MALAHSSFYATSVAKPDDPSIVAEILAICSDFHAYGYRRVSAELRHRDMIVNTKKVRRIMREHDLNPKRRRRYVATTDSDHGGLFIQTSPRALRFTVRTSSGSQT